MAIDFYLAIGMVTQAEIIRKPDQVSTTPVERPIEAPIPSLPEPAPSKPKLAKAELPSKSQADIKPEATPKPGRTGAWIGVGLISLLVIGVLALAGFRLLIATSNAPKPTATLNATVPNPDSSPLPSAAPNLPAGEGMVQVPSGSYQVGFSPAEDHHVAQTTIPLNNYFLDQYLTTNGQYGEYMSATGAPAPLTWPGEGDHPVIGVTWDQAAAFCQWKNKRLPSEAEWEAAGRGPGVSPQLYPWGNDVTAEGQANKMPDQDTYPVGTQSFNQSPFKIFDMVGNVWEWVGDPYASIPAGYKILRGGRYGLPINDLAYRLAVIPGDTPYVKFAGFRCAADQVK
jgi:formylglycine-generating enzyme required for sulfatase activity